MIEYKELDSCLACGKYNTITPYFYLGLQPLVNNLKDSPHDPDKQFPIMVNKCTYCTHKQLSIAVDQKLLFSKYLYKTGISLSHRLFFDSFVEELAERKPELGSILDIGCNDGSLLRSFVDFDWEVMGVEPSDSFDNSDLPIIKDFFPTKQPITKRFDCITAFNVFAHNSNPYAFLIEMAKLLKPDGRIYILTTRGAVDSLYHEHISYFNPLSMVTLALRCGLHVVGFKEVSMHGKSNLFELANPEAFPIFSIPNLFKSMVAYGASANGIVLMNHLKFKPEYVIDDNPLKQGKFIPGVNSPVYCKDHLAADERDLTIVVLAYHLFDEIVAKIKAMRPGHNDIFIHPQKGAK